MYILPSLFTFVSTIPFLHSCVGIYTNHLHLTFFFFTTRFVAAVRTSISTIRNTRRSTEKRFRKKMIVFHYLRLRNVLSTIIAQYKDRFEASSWTSDDLAVYILGTYLELWYARPHAARSHRAARRVHQPTSDEKIIQIKYSYLDERVPCGREPESASIRCCTCTRKPRGEQSKRNKRRTKIYNISSNFRNT